MAEVFGSGHQRINPITALGCLICLFSGMEATAQSTQGTQQAEKIIIDTDIGDDIDDAFAVALALRSPEFNILGITTAYGDAEATEARAHILDRMLGEAGRTEIPVAVGVQSPFPEWYTHALSQRRYGEGGHFTHPTHPNAVEFILEQIRRYPGQITLVTIAPLPNIAAVIDKDLTTFRKLKRIVMMGGNIAPIKSDYSNEPARGPSPEWNIMMDVPAAQKVFDSGVPLYVMPLDATFHLKLDDVKRNMIFAHGNALTDALTLLYHQWAAYDIGGSGWEAPVLHDSLTLAFLLQPALCPVKPMRIRVDDKGVTRVEAGQPNANVCLHSDADGFLRLHMHRLLDRY